MTKRALVLDFGGVITKTLFETHPASEDALGLPRGSLAWRGPFAPETDPLWQDMQAGKITERDYYFQRARETGALIGETWESLPPFLTAVRGNNPEAVIRPEALDAIQAVKRAGNPLAVLSNELDLFYGSEFRKKLPFLNDFDLIVDATHTGILKPDPRAYAFVTEGLGLAPDQCVFVDDQLKNIHGGKAAGFRTVHFDVTQPAQGYAEALAQLNISAE